MARQEARRDLKREAGLGLVRDVERVFKESK